MDRAALDAALSLGIECGGFVPKGRLAEDGVIPEKYPVTESDSPDYIIRTELNVINSDATLILNRGELSSGTFYTLEFCRQEDKPFCVIQLESHTEKENLEEANKFIKEFNPLKLNIAGPRESKCPGIYKDSYGFLVKLLRKKTGSGLRVAGSAGK